MKSNYNKIGNYIQLVDVRNSALNIDTLLGINIDKYFMPSVANIVGTDLSTYKIVKKEQFACNRMHVGRDERLPVALSKSDNDFIVSPAYNVFEVVDKTKLLPEYLMMWFSRAEFDRNACFYTDADVRGGLSWDSFSNMTLPVPHIDKQKEIVKEYNTIVNRIELNKKLCQKLEETAQAIYREWFVDFEFPNEEGKPYKSSGGEMIESELGEIPKGWVFDKIGKYVKLSQGLVMNATTSHLVKDTGIPLLRITDLVNDTKEIFIDESVDKKNLANKDDIIISRTGQVGMVFRNKVGVIYNNCFKIIPIESFIKKDFLFRFLKMKDTYKAMVELASGSSAQYDLTHTSFNTIQILIPLTEIQEIFSIVSKPIDVYQVLKFQENQNLNKLKELLLSKLTKAGG